MKNILSYQVGSLFKGNEIKEYLLYKTGKGESVAGFKQYLNVKDDEVYMMVQHSMTEAGKHRIGFVRYYI